MRKSKIKQSHRIFRTAWMILFVCAVLLFGNIYASYHWLVVRNWEVTSDRIEEPVKLVVLSDLHTNRFGENNERLIETVRNESPDLILLAGDMINEDATDDTEICSLVSSLSPIAPVYYGIGNHEISYVLAQYGSEDVLSTPLAEHLTASGAILLDQTYEDVIVNGNALRIGGMYAYAFGLKNENLAEEAPEEVQSFLKEMEDTEDYRIIISHRPDSFIFGNAASYWDLDLVISGHNHGGQVTFGEYGLYGGDQGFFPTYIHGLYEKDEMNIFCTSGLGSQREILPRVNNRPEVAVVTLNSGQSRRG